MLIGIAYDHPRPLIYGEEKDKTSEEAVLECVSDVQKELAQLGHCVVLLPLKDSIKSFIHKLTSLNPDCIFNLCESAYGLSVYEMNMPSIFELFRIPYTGSPPIALRNCLDKVMTKYILLGSGLPTPKFDVISDLNILAKKRARAKYSFPLIVKPRQEDGSRGISVKSVVFDESALKDRIEYILTMYNQPALIENFVEGRELNVSLIGNDPPEILSISEIDFSKLHEAPKVITYDGKWNEKSKEYANTPVVCPAEICDSLKERIAVISRKAYGIMGCRGYARIDFRVDESDKPYVIDVNPNPDISRKAGFARSAEKSGISYSMLIQKIVNLAFESNLKLRDSKKSISIREMVEEDIPIIIKMLSGVSVFRKAEIDIATEIINSYLKKSDSKDYLLYVADYGANHTIGYTCFGPTPFTEDTYDIYWIAVDQRFQNIGVGRKLLKFAEDNIGRLEGRKIIIETSSKKEYEHARSLYKNAGYKEVARILNFYSLNDDKIIYEKELSFRRV